MKNREHGFTLIELMIALVVVGVLAVGLSRVFQFQTGFTVETRFEAESQANVQAAGSIITNDLVMAGFGNVGVPIAHVNSADPLQADSLTLTSAAQGHSVIHSFVLTGNNVAPPGNLLKVRCWGTEGHGGLVDPTRDLYFDANRPLFIWLVNPLDGKPLTGVGPNPVLVTASDVAAGNSCDPGSGRSAFDANRDNLPDGDPYVELTLAGTLSNVIGGATVYGVRVPNATPPVFSTNIAYTVNPAYDVGGGRTKPALLRNGVPLLLGVEDFQVRFRVVTNPVANTTVWTDDLAVAGLNPDDIDLVRFSLLVRSPRRHPRGVIDARTQVQTYDHIYPLSDVDREFSRKSYEFTVRPNNVRM